MKMRIKFINALLAVVVLLFPFALSFAQQAGKEPAYRLSVRLRSGINVAIATETEPPEPRQLSFNGFQAESGNVVHRVLADTEGGFIYGYDLKVELLPNSKQFRVSISPFSQEFVQRLREGKSFRALQNYRDLDASSLSLFNYSQVVNDGDAFAYDLLVNRSTGVKIVDIIKVSYSDVLLGGPPAPDVPARDFALSDVELKMSNYRLLINGELVYGDKPTGGCSGAIIWFYLPGKGRFIFSITPREEYDFQKAGLIEHNKISFSHNGDQYEWISSFPIVASGGRWNLYVLHDGDYRPELDAPPGIRRMWERWERSRIERQAGGGNEEDFLKSAPPTIGASDSIELLFSKKNN